VERHNAPCIPNPYQQSVPEEELEDLWRSYFVVTFVRNAYTRAISSYRCGLGCLLIGILEPQNKPCSSLRAAGLQLHSILFSRFQHTSASCVASFAHVSNSLPFTCFPSQLPTA